VTGLETSCKRCSKPSSKRRWRAPATPGERSHRATIRGSRAPPVTATASRVALELGPAQATLEEIAAHLVLAHRAGDPAAYDRDCQPARLAKSWDAHYNGSMQCTAATRARARPRAIRMRCLRTRIAGLAELQRRPSTKDRVAICVKAQWPGPAPKPDRVAQEPQVATICIGATRVN
jgi:hypothetical protein